MKKSSVFALFLFALLIVTFVIIIRGVKAKNIRVNKRDLPEHGLKILGPTDPSFDTEVRELSAGRSEKQKRLIEIMKPFSVFIRNSSSQDVIAYNLRWDTLQQDGTVATHVRTYAEPSALMGQDPRALDEATRDAGVSIKANSSRFVSLDSSIAQPDEPGAATLGQPGIGANFGSDASGNEDQIQKIAADRNEAALAQLLGTELARSESLTVTLDVAVFEDGNFVGADSLNYIPELQALIDAKRDVLNGVLMAARQNIPPDHMFKRLESIVNGSETETNLNRNETEVKLTAKMADSYRQYRIEFAKELLRIRAANADDQRVVWYATRQLFRPWHKLHRREIKLLR